MVKKLLSLMLLITISSSIFCMESPEEKNKNSGKIEKQKVLKRLAKENKQQEIIDLIGHDEDESPVLDENYDFIVKLIE